MKLETGVTYIVKHSSGMIRARFIGEHVIPSGPYNRRTRRWFIFKNLKTNHDITIKSMVKIRRVATDEDENNPKK